jgi:hypothetical protein
VSETALFAVEEEASDLHLEMGLAAYRRLNASQRAACAVELKRRVETEIAEQRRSRRRQKGFVALVVGSIFGRSLA